MHRLLATLFVVCFSSANAFADIPHAQCRVVDDRGAELISLKPLYPVRQSSLYRISEDLYIDVKYDALASSVAVVMVEMPHYPWTFSEKVIGESTLHLQREASKDGAVPIGAVKPGAQLICREIKD